MTFRERLKLELPDEFPDDYVDYLLSKRIYLAAPYMHSDMAIREQRFQAVNKFAGELMRDNIRVFSPLSHNHPITTTVDLPRDWEFWKKFDIPELKTCAVLIVLKLPGWEQSTGVAAEIEFAKSNAISVFYTNP